MLNLEIEFRGRDRYNKWHYGFLDYRDTSLQIHVVEDIPPTMQDPCGDLYSEYFTIIPETIGMYTNFKIKNDRKIYTDDIIFKEIEEDEGDIRFYLIATFIKEWNMFTWLNIGEYNNYQDNGIDVLDEILFWSYNIGEDKHSNFNYAGNIHDNPELLTK